MTTQILRIAAAFIVTGSLEGAVTCGDSTPIIDVHQIVRQVVPKDAIPALVRPGHVDVTSASFLRGDDRVVTLQFGAEAVGYPTRILDHHEVVNDVVAGRPVVVTY